MWCSLEMVCTNRITRIKILQHCIEWHLNGSVGLFAQVFIVLQTSCSHFNMRAYKSFKDKNQHLFAVKKMWSVSTCYEVCFKSIFEGHLCAVSTVFCLMIPSTFKCSTKWDKIPPRSTGALWKWRKNQVMFYIMHNMYRERQGTKKSINATIKRLFPQSYSLNI